MDLRLLHPGHPLRLRTEISRVRKIARKGFMNIMIKKSLCLFLFSSVPTILVGSKSLE